MSPHHSIPEPVFRRALKPLALALFVGTAGALTFSVGEARAGEVHISIGVPIVKHGRAHPAHLHHGAHRHGVRHPVLRHRHFRRAVRPYWRAVGLGPRPLFAGVHFRLDDDRKDRKDRHDRKHRDDRKPRRDRKDRRDRR